MSSSIGNVGHSFSHPPFIGKASSETSLDTPKKSVSSAKIKTIREDFAKFKERIKALSLVEELKNDSLIEESGLKDSKSLLFAHLHLGARAKSTQFEGLSQPVAVKWAKLFLTELQKGAFKGKLLDISKNQELLDAMAQLYETSQKISDSISSLSNQAAHSQTPIHQDPLIQKMKDIEAQIKQHLIDMQSTGLVGNPIDILQIIQDCEFLSNQLGSSPSQNHESTIQDLIEKEAMEIAKKVKNLKSGESYFTDGGYQATPYGHAMKYSFKREEDNTYTIVIYNAGEGAKWQSSQKSDLHEKVNPFVVFSKVKEKELFFTEGDEIKSGIFQSLLELLVLPEIDPLDPRFFFKIEDVWKAFSPLQHRIVEGTKYNAHFLTLQRSGTCAQKSLNALLLDLCQDPVAFKTLSLNSQLLSLVNFYHAQKNSFSVNTSEMSQVRFQMKEAAENLIQKLSRYTSGKKEACPPLSDEMLKEYLATCLDIIELVDEAEHLAKGDQKKTPFLDKTSIQIEKTARQELKKLGAHYQNIENSTLKSFDPPIISYPGDVKVTPQNAINDLLNLLNDPTSETKEIEQYIAKLPPPIKYPDDPFWSKVGNIKIEDIQRITELMHYYIGEKTKNGPLSTPVDYQTVLSFIAIMHQLCWQYDKTSANELLHTVCLDLQPFEDLYRKDPYLIPDDPKSFENYQKLLSYFRSQDIPEKRVFNYVKARNVKSPEFKAELELYINMVQKDPLYLDYAKNRYLSLMKKKFKEMELSDLELVALAAIFEVEETCQAQPFCDHFKNTNNRHIASIKQVMIDAYMGLGLGEKLKKEALFSAPSSSSSKKIKKNSDIIIEGYFGNISIVSSGSFLDKDSEIPATFLHNSKKNIPEKTLELLSTPYILSCNAREPGKSSVHGEGARLQAFAALDPSQKKIGKFAAAGSEPKGAVASIFYQLLQNPSIADDPAVQGLIAQMLYRPVFLGNAKEPYIPLYEAMKSNGVEMLTLLQKVIKRSIKLYFSSQTRGNFNISLILYYLRLGQEALDVYRHFHQDLPPFPLFPSSLLIELKTIYQKDGNENRGLLAALSLHRLNDLLIQSKPNERNPLEWEEIYAEWMALSSLGSLDLWPEIDENLIKKVTEKMEAERPAFINFISKSSPQDINNLLDGLSNQIDKDLPQISSVLQGRTSALQLPGPSSSTSSSSVFSSNLSRLWKSFSSFQQLFFNPNASAPSQNSPWLETLPSSLVFRKQMPHGSYLQFNLAEGLISTNNGPLSMRKIDKNDPTFKLAFGSRKIVAVGLGDTIQFTDAFYGECRILGNRAIQRMIGSNWFTLVPKDVIQASSTSIKLPKAIQEGYCHWICTDPSGKSTVIMISSQETGDDRYYIDQNGIIRSWPLSTNEIIEPLDKTKAPLLADFEDPGFILCKVNENGDRERLEVTRYKTADGSALTFTADQRRWVYDQDPNYAIDNEALKYFSSSFSEFLALKHMDGKKRKLLIANRDIEALGFSKMASFKPLPLKTSSQFNQEKLFSYFEYEVLGDHLEASSPDGWLMLSTIFLAEKNYLLADECLAKVTVSEELTEEGKELLKKILTSGPDVNDYSPNASAIRLKAFWILKKLDPFTSGYADLKTLSSNKSSHQNIIQVYETYLKGLNNVSKALYLSKEMEIELLEMIEAYGIRHYFLKNDGPMATTEKFLSENPEKIDDIRNFRVSYIYGYPTELSEIESPFWEHYSKTLESMQDHPQRYYASNFLKDYTTLKNGSEPEKNELIYKLQFGAKRSLESSFLPPYYEQIFHFVYSHPDLCPEPISVLATDQEKMHWMGSLIKAIREFDHDYSIQEKADPFSKVYQPDKFLKFTSNVILNPETSLKQTPITQSAITPFQTRPTNASFDSTIDLLKTTYCKKMNAANRKALTPDFEIDSEDLSKEELPFLKVIEAEMASFNEELKKGKKRLSEEAPYKVIKSKEQEFEKALRDLQAEAQQKSQALEKKALSIARALPIDEKDKLQASLQKAGYRESEITISQLARLSVFESREEYQKLMPSLSFDEAEKLHGLIIEYMTCQTSLDQIERVLKSFDMIHQSKALSARKKEALLSAAATALSQKRQYLPQDNIQALYFEYASQLRLRKSQASLFKNILKKIFKNGALAEKGLVFQMIQGGGKSSVILSQLAELISERGYLTILVSHHSQKYSLHGSMKKFQRKRFEKNVIPLNYSSSDLNKLTHLLQIEKKLVEAKKNKDTVILDSAFLQSLQLQLLKLLKERNFSEEDAEIKELDAKIAQLQKINRFIFDEAVGLLDEVDLTLDIFQRMNFPSANRNYLPHARVQLLKEIFQIFSDPSNDAVLGLSKNEQKDFIEKDYFEKVVPAVAKGLIEKTSHLHLQNTPHLPAFVRYLNNSIDKKIEAMALSNEQGELLESLTHEEKQDLAFLKYLHHDLKQSQDLEKKEAATLIALSRGLLFKILPATLRKSYNKDYGYNPNQLEQIIPYLAVGIPADTEFGNVYEHLCYLFQSSLNAPITLDSVKKYAEIMTQMANQYVLQGEDFNETAEAKQFLAMTGVPLSKVKSIKEIKKAAKKINQDDRLKLELQTELAFRTVSYYPSFLSNSPLAMVDQLKFPIGCSGSIGNKNSFNAKISSLLAEEGVEGKIITTLLERNQGGQKEVKALETDDLRAFLENSFDGDKNSNLHCLIDGGGLLMGFKPQDVAKGILDYYKRKDDNQRIKGVVFYYKEGKKEGFALLKNEASSPIFLSNTTKEEIEKFGVPIENLFFSFDELRATGSDMPMPHDAKGIGTANANDLRHIEQTVMRLRNLFSGQDIGLVMASTTEKNLIGSSKKLISVLQTAIKNQAIQKSHETFRSFKEQIPNFYRNMLMKEIQETTPERAAKLFSAFSPFLEDCLEDAPFELFGLIEEKKSAVEIFEEVASEKSALFEKCLRDSDGVLAEDAAVLIRETVAKQLRELNESAKKLPELNCLFATSTTLDLGLQLQLMQEVSLTQETKLQVSLEIDEEEKSYKIVQEAPVFQAIDWNFQAVDPFDPFKVGPSIYSVSTLLDDCDSKTDWIVRKGLYRINYSTLFPPNLKMTENMRFTLSGTPLPVFNSLQKPGENVLIRKKEGGELECIMLCKKDLADWIEHGETPKGMWLLNAEGHLVLPSKENLPSKKDSLFWGNFDEALWHVNFFNGNIAALIRQPLLSKAFFEKDRELCYRFLLNKTAHDPELQKMLFESALFSLDSSASSARIAEEKDLKASIAKMKQEEIQSLNPKNVHLVPNEKVHYLKDEAQLKKLLPSQVNWVSKKYVNLLSPHQIPHIDKDKLLQALELPSLIKRVKASKMSALTNAQLVHHLLGVTQVTSQNEIQAITDPDLIEQFTKTQIQHILPSQVPHINVKHVSSLTKIEHIQALKDNSQINSISPSAIKHLTSTQIKELRSAKLILQVLPDQIKHLHPLAIVHLDVLKQLEHLDESQYRFISPSQHKKLMALKPVPLPLKPIWNRLHSDNLSIYRKILKDAEKPAIESMPGVGEWTFLIALLEDLKEEDYAKVKSIFLSFNPDSKKSEDKYLDLPKEVFRCKNLRALSISRHDLSFLDRGEQAFNFPQLKTLELTDVNLTQFPDCIREMKKLEKLEVKSNKIEILPTWIGELKDLTYLDISQNKFRILPDEIGNLEQLKNLYLDRNQLESLPDSIGKLTKVQHFEFWKNKLKALPETIGGMKKVQRLIGADNELESLPISFGSMTSLETVSFFKNRLTTLPNELEKLEALTTLILGENPIEEFPKAVIEIPKLTLLNLEGCKIKEVPKTISKMKALRHLHLSANPILKLPEEIGELKNLSSLALPGSSITQLPQSIGALQKLINLDLMYTRVSDLPSGALMLNSGLKLTLKGSWIKPDHPLLQKLRNKKINVDFESNLNPHLEPQNSGQCCVPEWKLKGRSSPDGEMKIEAESLEELVKDNKSYEILQLVKGGLSPNTLIKEEESLFEWALKNKDQELTKECLERGANLKNEGARTSSFSRICKTFSNSPDLISMAAEKRGIKDLAPEEIKDLQKVVLKSKDFSMQLRLFGALKESLADKIPKNRLSDKLRRRSQKYSKGLIRGFLRKSASALDRIQLAIYKIKRRVGAIFRKMFPFSKKISVKKMGLKTLALERKLNKQKKEIEKLLNKFANGSLDEKETKKLTQAKKSTVLKYAREFGTPQVVANVLLSTAKKEGTTTSDQVIANLFLDKSWVMTKTGEVKGSETLNDEGLFGIRPYIASSYIVEGIRKALVSPALDLPDPIKTELQTDILNTLERAAAWEKMLSKKGYEKEVVDEVYGAINHLESGKRVLLPIGSPDHNFLVQIKKTQNSTFSLKVINTGLGISHHARFNEKRYFQTFKLYENIPEKSLMDKNLWTDLLKLHHVPTKNVDKHYQLIAKLADGGKEAPASKKRLDYSTAQLQGSCGAAPWWSWLRHEITEMGKKTKEGRYFSYGVSRSLKNEARAAILQKVTEGEPVSKIHERAKDKIEKHGHLAKLLKVAQERDLFNLAMQNLHEMLLKLMPEAEIKKTFGNLNKDFNDYKNAGIRWHLLHELSKAIAEEVINLRGKKRKEFTEWYLNDKSKKTDVTKPHLDYIYFTMLDLESSEKHLVELFKDAEQKQEWGIIGSTLGRLALDHKMSSLAIKLAKQWLTLSHEAEAKMTEESSRKAASQILLSYFLFYVGQGKSQEKTLRELAIYFRGKGALEQAERFWKEYRIYKGASFAEAIEKAEFDSADIALIANTLTDINDVITLLLALRKDLLQKGIKNVIEKLIDQAIALDDKSFSRLKKAAEALYAAGYDQMASAIEQKVIPLL